MNSHVYFTKKLPSRSQVPTDTVLFYDSILERNKEFSIWLKKFEFAIPLKSGESLKTIESFQSVLNKITKLNVPQSTSLTFLSVGGGSVGDFVGFLASVYLRGRDLIHIPSTWLAAIDSAHGGKNGLNFQNVKNQIGSFYPATKIYVCEELLQGQPPERLKEAMGEIIKTAILFDAKLFSEIAKDSEAFGKKQAWGQLPRLIQHKNKIVKRDPFEKKGLRRLLNLGHTMGHVFESHFGWPHGIAVLLGLQFSARWSHFSKLLNERDFFRISLLIDSLMLWQDLDLALNQISDKKIIDLLGKDKKLVSSSKIDFIFIKKIGQCERKPVTLNEIIDEVTRQRRR